MALVEVLDVAPAPVNPRKLRGFAIDTPRAGTTSDVYDFDLTGWIVGLDTPVASIEVHVEGRVIRQEPVNRPRPDVAQEYPGVEAVETSGFHTNVSTIGLEPGAELQLRAVFKDNTRVRLGAIRIRREPMRTGFDPTLRPLMLTTLGRAGTTWAMRLLAEHPKIVAHRWYPYELRSARYWMHMFKVLSEPRDPYRSAQADYFQTEHSWVGQNPFYPEPISTTPGLREWFGKTYLEQFAAFAQRSADECYTRIAAAQGQPDAVYFAEKHRADYLPWLYWELYPNAKEIFLVRDFRDVFSSMLAFNAKQGRRVFGNDRLADDEEFARFLRRGPVRLLASNWPKRQDRAHLIRYEDLIQDPVPTLRGLLAYLEIDNDQATIDGILERAGKDNPEMKRHLTSTEVSTSIGRWRQSLDPALHPVVNEVFGDVLEQFGYAV